MQRGEERGEEFDRAVAQISSRLADICAERSVVDERLDELRRIVMSKQFYQTAQHVLVIETKCASGSAFMPTVFPHDIATYNESRNDAFSDITDAAWYVQNSEIVMTKPDHLPSYHDIVTTAATFLENQRHRVVHDGPVDRSFLRPQVTKPLEEDDAVKYVCGEAELRLPYVLPRDNDTQFRIRIEGRKGTNGDVKRTQWMRGSDVIQQAKTTMQRRKQLLQHLKQEVERCGPGGKVHVEPNPLLCGGISMHYLSDGFDAAKAFFLNEEIPFENDDHAMMTNFTLFWKQMAGGKRALAIGSVTAVFKYRRTECAHGHECGVCFDPIEDDGWICSGGCGKRTHRSCMHAWRLQCDTRTATCPFCRRPI